MKNQTQQGFSLVELIAVVAITAIMSIVSVSILITSQVRSSRIGSVNKLRQEGEFLMRDMTYLLRNSRYVVANQFGDVCTSGMEAIRVRTADDSFIELYALEGRVASNSGILITEEPDAYLSSTEVSVGNTLTFNCSQGDDEAGALVNITFTLTVGTPGVDPAEKVVSESFSGDVYLRTYQ